MKTLERCKHVLYIYIYYGWVKLYTAGRVIEKSHNWEMFILKLFYL